MMITIVFSSNLQAVQSNPAQKPHFPRSLSEVVSKTGEESFPKTKPAPTISPESKTEIVQELEKLIKTVEGKPTDDESCKGGTCTKLKKGNEILKKPQVIQNIMLKPAYSCDEWLEESRICFLNRNLGNTVTFVLSTPSPEKAGLVRVEWRQEFSTKDPKHNKTIYHINPKDTPWNMVIGSRGHELRVSPITESDMFANYFTAVVHYEYGTPTRKLHFVIRTIAIEVGELYPGATMTLHVPSFISLPSEGMTFNWTLNGGTRSSLPSNMRPSPSGASLRISELRKEQEGIVVCFIYSNIGIQAAIISFNIEQVESDHNQLVFVATRPPHKIRKRKKRSHKAHDISAYFKDSVNVEKAVNNLNNGVYLKEEERKLSLVPRYLNRTQDDGSPLTQARDYAILMVVEHEVLDPDIGDGIEDVSEYRRVQRQNQANAIQEATGKTKIHGISTNKNISPKFDVSFKYFNDTTKGKHVDSNSYTDIYLQGGKRELFTPKSVSKRQHGGFPSAQEPKKIKDQSKYRPVQRQNSTHTAKEAETEILTYGISKNRKKRSPHLEDSPNYSNDPGDSRQMDINTYTNIYLKEEEQEPFIPRSVSKRQDSGPPPSQGLGNDPPMDVRDYEVENDKQLNSGSKRQDSGPPPSQELGNDSTMEVGDYEVEDEKQLNSDRLKQRSYFGDFDSEEYQNFQQEAMDLETPKPPPTRRPSLDERRRHAFLSHFQKMHPKRQQTTTIPTKRFHTTTKMVDVEGEANLPPLQERDKLAKLIGKCDKDTECSTNAECVNQKNGKAGFCRCLPTFEGNGLFCWEGDKWII